jgi:hypothetical protein
MSLRRQTLTVKLRDGHLTCPRCWTLPRLLPVLGDLGPILDDVWLRELRSSNALQATLGPQRVTDVKSLSFVAFCRQRYVARRAALQRSF